MHFMTYTQLYTAVLFACEGIRLLHRKDSSPSQGESLAPMSASLVDPRRDEVVGQELMKASLAAPVSDGDALVWVGGVHWCSAYWRA